MHNIKVFPSFESPPNASEEDKKFLSELRRLKLANLALYVNFSLIDYRRDNPDTTHFLTYPMTWITEYVRHQYNDIDPLLRMDYRQLSYADWMDLQLEPRVQEMFYKFQQFGLGINGLTVVNNMGNKKFGILGMTFDVAESEWSEFKAANMETYRFQIDQLCDRYIEIYHGKPQDIHKITPREAECLYWVAIGQTDDQIANTLNIGKWTVVTHIKNAKLKLGSPNRAAAVAVAISTGIIDIRRAG